MRNRQTWRHIKGDGSDYILMGDTYPVVLSERMGALGLAMVLLGAGQVVVSLTDHSGDNWALWPG